MKKRMVKWVRNTLFSIKRIVKITIYASFFSIFCLSLYANYRHKVEKGEMEDVFTFKNLEETISPLEQHFEVHPKLFSSLSQSEKTSFLEDLLEDRENRISNEFDISSDFKERVLFWFKVFNLYSSNHIILHDSEMPWKIFAVVNTAGMSKSKEKVAVSQARSRIGKSSSQVREQRGLRNSIAHAIKQSGLYIDNMEEIFAKHHLPIELTRLPIVESSFNPKAYSYVGAAGMWQFMRKTGKHFLDKIDNSIDERLSPLKATEAAAELLKENYKIFGDWPLAISAYHHGPALLHSARYKLGTKHLPHIIKKFEHPDYGFASKNYYAEFLAALYTEKYHDLLFEDLEKKSPLTYDDIVMEYSMRVKTIMEICNVSLQDIKTYNPELKSKAFSANYYLPEDHWLKLPLGSKKYMDQFNQEAEEAKQYIEALKKKGSR